MKAMPFRRYGDPEGCEPLGYAIFCPGCKCYHALYVRETNKLESQWTFTGTTDFPTFRPSLGIDMQHPESRCHSFITEGKIQFLNDCFHELAGKTVDLPDVR